MADPKAVPEDNFDYGMGYDTPKHIIEMFPGIDLIVSPGRQTLFSWRLEVGFESHSDRFVGRFPICPHALQQTA